MFTGVGGYLYDGMYLNGLKHGRGFIRYTNGNSYNGEFRLDKMDGAGIMSYPDGTFKEGLWADDENVIISKTYSLANI